MVLAVFGPDWPVHQVSPEDSTRGPYTRWGSVEQRGGGFVCPQCLDGGKDFLLVASKGHAHSEQVSMETDSVDSIKNWKLVW